MRSATLDFYRWLARRRLFSRWGANAAVSHRTAAAAWGLAEHDPRAIDITVVSRRVRVPDGIRLHRVTKLARSDLRTRRNITLTAPARTMIDLAATARWAEVEHAFGEARAKRLITDGELEDALLRAPRNHPGAAILRKRLVSDPGSTYTRSRAEARIRELLAAAELPQPLVNRELHGFTVDFLWPSERVVLEVDGYRTHGDRLSFERDRRRDQIHSAAGYTVIRVTWRQLCEEPFAVVARIAQALALRRPPADISG